MVLCRVMFLLRWENFTSTSFLGFNERCQYLDRATEVSVFNGLWIFQSCMYSAQRTCMWTQVWAAPLQLCTPPEIFPLSSPAVWFLWSAQERRVLNAAFCGHTGSWSLPSSSAWCDIDELFNSVSGSLIFKMVTKCTVFDHQRFAHVS